MKPAVAGLVIALTLAGCRPIDGDVVVRTDPTPTATATNPSTASPSATRASVDFVLQEYPVTRGQGPHDVAPARDGGVWYTAQLSGELGWLDPKFGVTKARRSACRGVRRRRSAR
jgi:streptogramin lyase